MKKIFCLIICICLFCCSCAIKQKPAELQKSRAIPENGIIDSEIISQLKKKNGICVFSGESNGVSYSWTVFGNKIKTPDELNLRVDVLKETENSVAFKTEIHADFELMLSLYLNNVWSSDSIVLTVNGKNKSGVSLTKEKNSVININISESGQYEIIANTEKPVETVKTDAETSKKPSDGKTPAKKATEASQNTASSKNESERTLSDGKQTKPDQYHTDPVPEGKPLPVDDKKEPDTETECFCFISVECTSILNHIEDLDTDKLDVLPSDGIILKETKVTFSAGETVYDVLTRICEENEIPMEASWTPMYNSYYIEGIHNLYEFDCGSGSGWMYRVNGWYPNYGCSRYELKNEDKIEFRYTCDLGADIGGGFE